MIGDYNNDGLQDFAVSSDNFKYGSRMEVGVVAIILGQSDGSWEEVDLSTQTSGLKMRRIIGAKTYDYLGASVASAGDVNKDGFADVLIGANGADYNGRSNSGAVYVIFGMASTIPYTDIDVLSFTPSATTGYIIYGMADSNTLGVNAMNFRAFGNLNGDSIDDFAVTAYIATYSSRVEAGAVWFIFGTTSTPVNLDLANLGSAGVLLGGSKAGEMFGGAIDNVGDFNGDGKSDILIGSYRYTSNSKSMRGAAYLLYGVASVADKDMSTFVTGAAGVRFLGAAAENLAGKAVSGAGDINGDGKMDILISAPLFSPPSRPTAGRVYAIFGRSVQFSVDFDLSTLTPGVQGFSIIGTISYCLGESVARGGDLDQDGIDDYVVAAPNQRIMYILYGSTVKPTANVDLLTYTGKVTAYEGDYPSNLGNSISGGVDLTGDGIPDLLVGAVNTDLTPAAGGGARSYAGAAYLMKGPISRSPTQRPTRVPTRPTVVPTLSPSSGDSAAPSVIPSAPPSVQPSVTPSTKPSALPSVLPSAVPTQSPTLDPTAAPSMPTVIPTAGASAAPSATPSALPSVIPSASPSVTPSVVPSVAPTLAPSAPPTAGPSVAPSAAPTTAPSVSPTVTPTARPTLKTETPSEVVLGVEQDLGSVTKDDYDAEKTQFNQTIQHTVADVVDGVTPDRVTDIVVEEEEEEGRVGNMRAHATAGTPRVLLKYKVTVYDPLLTANVLTAQLKAKVKSGEMDVAFHNFALLFNATRLGDGTFGAPKVTHLNYKAPVRVEDPPNDGETAGLVIGAVLFLVLLSVGVWLSIRYFKVGEEQDGKEGQVMRHDLNSGETEL